MADVTVSAADQERLFECFTDALKKNLLREAGAGDKLFIEHCQIDGIRDEYIVSKLLAGILDQQQCSQLLYQGPDDKKHIEVKFHSELTARALRLVTRTMAPGSEKAKYSAIEDVRILAKKWEQQLKTRKPLMLKEIRIVNALIEGIDVSRTAESFAANAATTKQPLCCITPMPPQDDDGKTLRIWIAIPSQDNSSVEIVEILPGAGRMNRREISCIIPNSAADEIRRVMAQPPNVEEGRGGISRVKVINHFMRHILGDDYPVEQLMFKHTLFNQFRESHLDWLEDPTLRCWGRELLVLLQNASGKFLSSGKKAASHSARQLLNLPSQQTVDQQISPVLQQIKECFQQITEAEQAIQRLEPPSADTLESTPTFLGCLDLDAHIDPNLQARARRSYDIPVPPEVLPPFDFSAQLLKQVNGQADEWIAYIRKLEKADQFELADRAAMAFLNLFKDSDFQQHFLEKVTRSKDIVAWSKRLETISSTIVKANFALARPCLPHTRIPALLRNFEIMQKLLRNDPVAKFTRHCEMEDLLFGLKDSYLDLGSSGPEVVEICSRLVVSQNEKGHKFEQRKRRYPRDLNIIGPDYWDNKELKESGINMESPTFKHTKQALQTLYLAIMPVQVLSCTLKKSSETTIKRREQLADQQAVKERLLQSMGDLKFTLVEDEKYYTVEPYGVHFHPYSWIKCHYSAGNRYWNTFGNRSNYFSQKRPIKRREIRKRIVDAIVSCSGMDRDEEGSNGCVFHYLGQCTSSLAIQNEQLKEGIFGDCSPSLCKQLQLMQTAPDYRVRQTILLFAEHSSLLEDSDWQRVMELNLFRFGYLYNKLRNDPDFAAELVSHLKKLYDQSVSSGSPSLGFMTTLLSKTQAIMQSVQDTYPDEKIRASVDALKIQRDGLIKKLDESLEYRDHKRVEKSKVTVDYQNDYRCWLLAMASVPTEEISDNHLVSIFRCHLMLSSFPRLDEHEDAYATISDCIDRLLPKVVAYLKEHPEKLADIASLRIKNLQHEDWQSDRTGIVWRNKTQRLNLQTGAIGYISEPTMHLPLSVRRELGNLISAEAIRAVYSYSEHIIAEENYKQIQLEDQGRKFKIFIPIPDGKPTILMQMEEGEWYQQQKNPFFPEQIAMIPRALQRLACWTHDEKKRMRFVDSHRNIKAEGEWDAATMRNVRMTFDSGSSLLLNPSDPSMCAAFERLDKRNAFVLLSDDDAQKKPHRILYPELGLSYDWDARQSCWDSAAHPGFSFSGRDLKAVLRPLAQKGREESPIAQVFSHSFFDYHLLENNNDPNDLRLVLNGRAYTPHQKGDDIHLQKHSRKRFAEESIVTDPPMLFTFTIDPERGLCSRQPSAYLYLSYVLYTQGKYPQAALAMRQAFQRMQGLTPQSQEILTFFEDWPCEELNACALRTQLALHVVEQNQMDQIDAKAATTRETQLKDSLNLYLEYCEKEDDIDPQLRLSQEKHEAFRFLARRSHHWIRERLKEKMGENLDLWEKILCVDEVEAVVEGDQKEEIQSALQNAIEKQINDLQGDVLIPDSDELRAFKALKENFGTQYTQCLSDLHDCFIDLKDMQFYAKQELFDPKCAQTESEDLLKWSLDREIEQRTASLSSLEEVDRQPESKPTEGCALFTDYDHYLERPRTTAARTEKMTKYFCQLQDVFKKKPNPYAEEMAQEVAEDFKYYCRSIGEPLGEGGDRDLEVKDLPCYSGLKEGADLNTLKAQMDALLADIASTVQHLQDEIISSFDLGKSVATPLRLLKEQDPNVMDLFRQGRWCFGEGNWKPLLDKKVITSDQIHTLSHQYKEYLIQTSQLKQIEKVQKQIDRIRKEEKNKSTEVQKLIRLLQAKRYYDADDLLAPSLLLLEDELGIICSKSQVQHFFDMVSHRSAFKHEAWGGGKTSVLRHLITKFHANKGHASSLLTHAPLIEEHHDQLRESTASFYGQEAYRTQFSRKNPTDGVAIRREHLKLVKAVQYKGRTDQTLNSMISSRHAHILNILSIAEEDDTQEAQKRVDAVLAFSRLLNFRQERMIIGSDELDQLFTPDQEHNYSTGASIMLSEDVYAPTFEILRLLQSKEYSEFLPYFVKNNPDDLPPMQQEELLRQLAESLFEKLQLDDLSKEEIVKYWMPMPDTIGSEEFKQYQAIHEKVSKHQSADLIMSIRVLLSTILPLSFHSRVGINFGRSADGIHTKPYSNSGECNERSQHGSVHLMVWYTCLDHFKKGIPREKQMQAIQTYIVRLKEEANKERREKDFTLDETETAKLFKKNFSINLSEVREANFPAIAKAINGNLESHLQNYLGCFLGLFPPRFGLVLANHAWLNANSALCEAKKSLRKPLQLILQVALDRVLLLPKCRPLFNSSLECSVGLVHFFGHLSYGTRGK